MRAARLVLLVLFLVSVSLMWLLNPDRSLEWELASATERYMVELGLTPTHYTILVADDVAQGAAVMQKAISPGRVLAMFLYDLEYMSQYPPNLRKVIVAHEVGHLAPICNAPGDRLSQELCADYVSLALVPYKDVLVAIAWHLSYPSSPVVEAEFRLRLQAVLSYAQRPPAEPSINLVENVSPDWGGRSERKEVTSMALGVVFTSDLAERFFHPMALPACCWPTNRNRHRAETNVGTNHPIS